MMAARRDRRLAAWLALCGLVLQIALTTAHSARHFDHLIGSHKHAELDLALLADAPQRGTDAPTAPISRDCAVDLCLAAAGTAVLADPSLVALPLAYRTVRLEPGGRPILPADFRHRLPPARAPPVIGVAV